MPNGAGDLLPPSALHDPRRGELLAVLDPDASFPAAELAGDGGALAGLSRLGLRGAAGAAVKIAPLPTCLPFCILTLTCLFCVVPVCAMDHAMLR